MPASHPLSWRRSSAERGKGFDGATRCNTCGPMETQLAAYWLASGDLYLFRRLSEDLALASTVLVLRGAYLTQNLKYFDAILIKFLRMLNASILSTLQANLFFHENTLRDLCVLERRRRRRCAAGDAMRAGAPAVADRAPRAPLVANVVVGALKDAITA